MEFDFSKYFNASNLERLMWALIILVVGVAFIYMLAYIVKKLLPKSLSQQRKMIIQRLVYYSGFLLLAFIIIAQLKINLAPFFGAAGVIGLIIGVASQTSIGNIVSGFFLVGEKSFEIGDVIKVGDKAGIVFSVDLLSIKIRTFDNQLLRIPNQTIISTELINVTRFPIRRLDFAVSVAYKEDLGKVKNVLEEVAKANPLSLDEPEPLIVFKDFSASGIDILLGVWFEKPNYLKVKNSIFQEIKARFDAEDIEIPFPHVTLYSGEATKPFPVMNTKQGTE
ncbi:mechanosensitive ion channel family protein [Draconibacterium halophilum]|uniref:Mechanosensitive ion channel family protein n=2 Tax=Draconibacterium halophilum TaxID=2706887 RepID=A0A6C0RD32_9BACT|nr:mechanosensitive ion channel family protein [Draconibacterium halophilum]